MTYEEKIASEADLTIEKIIDISEQMLPDNLRNRPWLNLGHGTDLLSSDEQLCRYMLAYGEMHAVKCRAAFQNFPFEKLISNIEIIDWGCGQGLATCVALEVLKERGLVDKVKKITLIEPSSAALNRAKINVTHKVKGGASVHTIQKYLPGDTDSPNCIENIQVVQPFVIHLFSNILDIPSINIKKLAEIVVSTGRNNYVLCMGPLNPNQWRMRAFAGYFHGAEFFSNIFSSVYGYTTRTMHPFGCRTQGFEFVSSSVQWDGLNGYEARNTEIHTEYIDDYSPVTKRFAQSKEFNETLLNVYEQIHDQLNPTDVLLLRPNISADTPDIVLYRPNVGIILFDVREEKLPMDLLDKADETNEKEPKKTLEEIQMEILSKVKSYENRLVDLHIANLREKIFNDYKFLKVIHKVIIFANDSQANIDKFYANVNRKSRNYTDMLSGNDLKNITYKIYINKKCPQFTEDIAKSFKKILTSPWHSYKTGRLVNLTNDQKRLAVSKNGVHHNVVSCAGAGKTEVLVHRAINANIRTGQPVLILTYNLALRNYIKYRLGLVAADFNWNDFVILNYHEFFNSQAINCDVRVHNLSAYEDLEYFKRKTTRRFASIFIDEAQDYKSSWLTILYKNFLKRGGEMVLFEDKSQDIYLWSPKALPIKFEEKKLRKGASSECRYKNDAIFNLVQIFTTHFKLDVVEEPTLKLPNGGVITYNLENGSNINVKNYGALVDDIIKKYGLLRDDCAVLASTLDLLQDIDLSYRKKTQTKTVTTFPTLEQHHKMSKLCPSAFAASKKSMERTKKLNFSMTEEGLKLSTIYSFKGWEADNIILFIQKPEPPNAKYDEKNLKPIEEAPEKALCPKVIYTALSRAKVNLFIINLGHAQYDQFFKKNIN